MLPRNLSGEQFRAYPPEARKLATANLDVLRRLPMSFLPALLGELIDYDYDFPAERHVINREMATLSCLSPVQINEWFAEFSQISTSERLEQFNWVGQPAQFIEQQSAYLWSTHQLDAYRSAATAYGDRLRPFVPPESLPVNRLGIAVIGQGGASSDLNLFQNLREHGAYFSNVRPDNGVNLLLNAVATRAKTYPIPYGHWYIEGGQQAEHSPLLTSVSYQDLGPVRSALLHNIQSEISRPGMGPEKLRTHLAELTPSDIGMRSSVDVVLNRFVLKVLTEGSGTQIFATTFAQWAAREALRRAQPLTLLVRFGPRQKQRPMNDLLSNSINPELDPVGSLIDADKGAYYNWINQQRLAGSERSSFLVWFEGHGQALVVSPSLARGTVSHSPASLEDLLSWASA